MNTSRWRKLTYRQATADDADRIMAFCRDKPCGTEIHTSVKLNGEKTEIGCLWTGTDGAGLLRLVVYDNGSYVTYLTRRSGFVAKPPKEDGFDRFAAPKRKARLCRMVYRGGTPSFPEGVTALRGTALLEMYKAVRETDALNDRTERRYVARARAVNAGLAETFGIYEDGKIASTAGICAKNERYALIGDVYTVYQYRFQGYAAKLVNACVAAAREQGLTPVLYCEKGMRKFYRKLGFVELAR
ncbi:MAG: GNAT family N-acetyltransferase [Clostridia bacterium]|nr:GNAT family N-acetyltransferase [Clostridia bacterium]